MKIVYRVLAGFFWIMIPISWFIGLLYSIYGNSELVSIVFGYSGALMFFILGIIVLLLGREKRNTKTISKRNCPKCGRKIPFDAKVCPYCQYVLTDVLRYEY